MSPPFCQFLWSSLHKGSKLGSSISPIALGSCSVAMQICCVILSLCLFNVCLLNFLKFCFVLFLMKAKTTIC